MTILFRDYHCSTTLRTGKLVHSGMHCWQHLPRYFGLGYNGNASLPHNLVESKLGVMLKSVGLGGPGLNLHCAVEILRVMLSQIDQGYYEDKIGTGKNHFGSHFESSFGRKVGYHYLNENKSLPSDIGSGTG